MLADLFVPEVREDCQTKKNTVDLKVERVNLVKKTVLVAQADVKAATAHLASAKAIWGQYDAQVVRWDSEVKRLKREVDRGVVDPQILLESENQLRASTSCATPPWPTSRRPRRIWNQGRPRCRKMKSPSRLPKRTCRSPRATGSAWKRGSVTSSSTRPSMA